MITSLHSNPENSRKIPWVLPNHKLPSHPNLFLFSYATRPFWLISPYYKSNKSFLCIQRDNPLVRSTEPRAARRRTINLLQAFPSRCSETKRICQTKHSKGFLLSDMELLALSQEGVLGFPIPVTLPSFLTAGEGRWPKLLNIHLYWKLLDIILIPNLSLSGQKCQLELAGFLQTIICNDSMHSHQSQKRLVTTSWESQED